MRHISLDEFYEEEVSGKSLTEASVKEALKKWVKTSKLNDRLEKETLKLTEKHKKQLYNGVHEFKTESLSGFIRSEVEVLLGAYPACNMQAFNVALQGNTCLMSDNGEMIMYHCDVYAALLCGLENRKPYAYEWD